MDHPSILTTVYNMAKVFVQHGEYNNKALSLFQRALDGWAKALTNEHPSTLTTVNDIA